MLGRTAQADREVITIDNGATAEPVGTPYASTWIQGSDPILGTTAMIKGGTRIINALSYTLFGAVAARPTPFGKYGFVHLDLSLHFGLVGLSIGRSFQHSLLIPNDLRLKGAQLMLQTFAFRSGRFQSTLEISNGLHWAIGN